MVEEPHQGEMCALKGATASVAPLWVDFEMLLHAHTRVDTVKSSQVGFGRTKGEPRFFNATSGPSEKRNYIYFKTYGSDGRKSKY